MKLLKIVPDKGTYIKNAVLIYENSEGNKKKYTVIGRRPIQHIYDLDGYVAGIMCVVRNTEGEILVTKEFRLAVNQALYGLPGGMQDHAETIEEAASREVFEECGIKDVTWTYKTEPLFINPANSNEKLVVIYGTTTKQETKASNHVDEEIESFWLSKDDLEFFMEGNKSRFSLASWFILSNECI